MEEADKQGVSKCNSQTDINETSVKVRQPRCLKLYTPNIWFLLRNMGLYHNFQPKQVLLNCKNGLYQKQIFWHPLNMSHMSYGL